MCDPMWQVMPRSSVMGLVSRRAIRSFNLFFDTQNYSTINPSTNTHYIAQYSEQTIFLSSSDTYKLKSNNGYGRWRQARCWQTGPSCSLNSAALGITGALTVDMMNGHCHARRISSNSLTHAHAYNHFHVSCRPFANLGKHGKWSLICLCMIIFGEIQPNSRKTKIKISSSSSVYDNTTCNTTKRSLFNSNNQFSLSYKIKTKNIMLEIN